MTHTIPSASRWKNFGLGALSLALDLSGVALMTTGQVLMVCGLQLRALSARFDRQ